LLIQHAKMTKNDLKTDEYHDYYSDFIEKTEGLDLSSGLVKSRDKIIDFYNSIPESKAGFRYGKGKWSVKEIIQHHTDTERVFSYRALCISRGDKTPLPNYDHDAYVENCDVQNRSIKELIEEYKSVRSATIALFESFDLDALMHKGIAGGHYISVRAIAFILMGHEIHHCEVLRERYL